VDSLIKKLARSQLVIPLFSLLLIIVFNLVRDVGFFFDKHCHKQPGVSGFVRKSYKHTERWHRLLQLCQSE